MTHWAYPTAPITTHAAEQISTLRLRGPGSVYRSPQARSPSWPVKADVGRVYQSAVRDRDLLITSGQLPIEGPSCGTYPSANPRESHKFTSTARIGVMR